MICMIPFIDLASQQQRIKPQIDAAVQRVLAHGQYIMGPEVKLLEERLAAFVGSRHCIAVSNGTDALVMALMAYGIGPGDAVITTPFTFFATVEAIMLLGATPVFADIDERTLNLCPAALQQAIQKTRKENKLHVRGIVPVDLFGLSADYAEIHRIASEHGLFVVQDAAQSFGALCDVPGFEGKRAPAHGHVGTASFFPAKPLGCYGDGGAVFSDDDTLAAAIRSISVHGKGSDKYDNVRVGLNARLDTLQAAILLEKLNIYSEEFETRQRLAGDYRSRIDKINEQSGSQVLAYQTAPAAYQSAWAQFVILSDRRDELATQLKQRSIPSVIYYRTPLHQAKACQGLTEDRFPVAESVSQRILALPFHPYLTGEVIGDVCAVLAEGS